MPQTQERLRVGERKQAFNLTSAAFAEGATIPKRYTADGKDLSPPLTWTSGPDGTASYAIVCEDPDAPRGTFVHWLAWNIDPGRHELREGILGDPETDGFAQGANGFNRIGWGGPSPPRGKRHRYVFHVYALDVPLALEAGADRAELDDAIAGHVLGEATLIGVYRR